MNYDLNIDDKESIQRDVNLIKAALDDDHDDGSSDELITEAVVDIDVDQGKNSRLALWSDGSSGLNTVPVSLDVTKIQRGDNVTIVNLCLKYLNDLQKLISLCRLKLTEVIKNIELQEVVLEESLDECYRTSNIRVSKRSKSVGTFATPYFRDAQKLTAPANEDAIQKRKNKDVDVYLQFPRPWTSVEHNLLLKAIKSTIKRNELDSLTARREYYFEKLEDCDFADERKGIKNKIKTVEEEINELKKRPHPENFPVDQKFDWMRISAHFPDMLRNHEECELMWRNYLHPAINKKKWTEEEDNKLVEIARIHQFRDWESIAEKMTLSKRTAIQCIERYQSHLNPNRLKSAWTSEDDEELRTIIEGCRNGDYIPWHQVTYYIGGRTRLQIVSRWQRTLNPLRKRGCWSEQEDVVLLAAVEKFGNNWTKMSEFLPGRSNLSCRERYTNCLLSGIRSGNWTKEEDQLLVNCVRKYGMGKWTKVATHLTGRTDAMVLSRANTVKKLCPYVFDGPPLDDPRDLSIPDIPTHQRKSKVDKKKEFFAHADEKILCSLMKVKGFKTPEEAQNYREKMKSSSKIFLEISKQILERPANNTFSDVSIKQEIIETQQEFLAAAVTCHRTEEVTIDEELNSLLKPFLPSDCRYNTMDFVFKRKSVKEELEYETVRHLLGGAMQCENVTRTYDVTDDSSSDFDTDYSPEISSVFDQCVIPKYMSSEVPIFPPNRATSLAFKQLLANRRIMDSLTTCLKGSNCIATLSCIVNCEKDEILQCSLCQSNIVSATFNKHEENSIKQLSNESLLLSNGSREESVQICQCEALNEMKNNYHLLRKRFLSLFFWPAILTLTSLTDDKKKLLTESRPTVTNCADLFARKRNYFRPHRRKNPWLRKSSKTVSGTPSTSVGSKATKKNVNKKCKIDTDTSDICLRRSARLKERETDDHLQVP